MQGVSASYGPVSLWRSDAKPWNRAHVEPLLDRAGFRQYCVMKLFHPKYNMSRRMAWRVRATWFYKEDDKVLGASSELSESANEDIMIFFFQLDLETRIQYALNVEQYDVAQQLRNKLGEVDEEIVRQREVKRGLSSKTEAQDKALTVLRMRADLQKAIDSEKYDAAARLRDEISKLEAESLAASAKALVYENVQYAFRLGQRIKHKIYGYQGVVCGMDPVCCESSSWMDSAHVDKLSQGPHQPFYQVLVDERTNPDLLVTYVSEENLLPCDQPDKRRFDHPYLSFLFYGMDSGGDFIPIKQLREKYDRPRHEVPLDMYNDGGNEGDS